MKPGLRLVVGQDPVVPENSPGLCLVAEFRTLKENTWDSAGEREAGEGRWGGLGERNRPSNA